MRMVPLGDGVAVAPGADAVLKPGAMHVMLIGLVRRLREGDAIELTLTFENAGDLTFTVPVGLARSDG